MNSNNVGRGNVKTRFGDTANSLHDKLIRYRKFEQIEVKISSVTFTTKASVAKFGVDLKSFSAKFGVIVPPDI